MPETFFILLAGGILLAAAVSDPAAVTVQWLRLGGILSLVMVGLSVFFQSRSGGVGWMNAVVAGAVLGQLGFVQIGFVRVARALSWLAFFSAIWVGVLVNRQLKLPSWPLVFSCAGIAAMCGLVLMDMLLGHAYLTASQMTMKPFWRLNVWMGMTIAVRAIFAISLTMILNAMHPVYLFWGAFGLFICTRWAVGLLVPAVFVYMTHDCIKRRSTQSATGILYVAGVLVFIGEIVALYLVRATGLPF